VIKASMHFVFERWEIDQRVYDFAAQHGCLLAFIGVRSYAKQSFACTLQQPDSLMHG
jgi:hypothetical protein